MIPNASTYWATYEEKNAKIFLDLNSLSFKPDLTLYMSNAWLCLGIQRVVVNNYSHMPSGSLG